MKRIMFMLLGLSAVASGVFAADPVEIPSKSRTYLQQAKDYINDNFTDYYTARTKYDTGDDRSGGFYADPSIAYKDLKDDKAKAYRRKIMMQRGGASAISGLGAGLAGYEILNDKNFLLDLLLDKTPLGGNATAQRLLRNRMARIITSLAQAIALDEVAGAVSGPGGRRGFVSGGVRDGYGWAKSKWASRGKAKSDAKSDAKKPADEAADESKADEPAVGG